MRGGKRSGAGRRKGAPNKATAARQAAIAASGEAPLDYMIRVMRDESAPAERRDEMAKAPAPYNRVFRNPKWQAAGSNDRRRAAGTAS
jgi:hypothetical protein